MLETTFTYDLFEHNRGWLTVEYNIFEKITESSLIPCNMVRQQLETRVRQIICDRIDRMRVQRSENYKYGEMWGIVSSKALFGIPPATAAARNIKDLTKFALYVQTSIRPMLDSITPGITSRFYEGFTKKLEQLDQYLEFIIRNPGFCDVFTRPEKLNKAV